MILIDTNSLVLLILGLIDTRLINSNKRTSIFEEQDFYDLLNVIGDLNNLVVIPNVWTELDNLLNKSIGKRKYDYVESLKQVIKKTTEKFLETRKGIECNSFYELGLTDSLLLDYSTECEMLITTDSKLSDYTNANGVRVFDVVQNRNFRL